jgi:Sigma-70, region 4
MSAALQLPVIWGTSNALAECATKQKPIGQQPGSLRAKQRASDPDAELGSGLAFYRKHTESMLRRYLYASIQVGRTPSILGDPVGRGFVSSRPIRTFEDAVIFVLDVERCLEKLGLLDRHLLSRIVLQEYTRAETAALLGISVRAIAYKLPQAVDRLTALLLEAGLLILPH